MIHQTLQRKLSEGFKIYCKFRKMYDGKTHLYKTNICSWDLVPFGFPCVTKIMDKRCGEEKEKNTSFANRGGNFEIGKKMGIY